MRRISRVLTRIVALGVVAAAALILAYGVVSMIVGLVELASR